MPRKRRKDLQQVIAEYETEVRRLAGDMTDSERRFLSVGLAKGKELEPIGRLAGTTRQRSGPALSR